jgi:hypothetical protein
VLGGEAQSAGHFTAQYSSTNDSPKAPHGQSRNITGESPDELLVDLVRFELTASSLPFKKYQSLAGNLAKKQRT